MDTIIKYRMAFSWLTPFLAILIIMLFLYSVLPFSMSTGFHDSQRLLSVIIISLISLFQLPKFQQWTITSLGVLYIIAFWGAIASVTSYSAGWSFLEVVLFLNIYMATILAFDNVNKCKIAVIAIAFISIQGFYAIRNLLNYLFIISEKSSLDIWDVIDGFSNIRFYGQFLSWTLPFAIGFLATSNPFKYRNIFIVIIIADWTLILMSGTRAFIFGMLFSLIITFWVTPRNWMQYFKWSLLTGFLGIIGYLLLIFFIPWVLEVDNSAALNSTINRDFGSSSGRMTIWQETLQIIIDHPFFGIGPMMTAMEGVLTNVAHPHNVILQLAAEWGIPFALLAIALASSLAWQWKKLIHQKPNEREKAALPITAAISSASAASMVDGLIVMPISLLYMCIIIGLGAALWRTWIPPINRFKLSGIAITLLSVLPLGLITITGYQWYHIDNSTRTHKPTPRYWTDGKIKLSAHTSGITKSTFP